MTCSNCQNNCSEIYSDQCVKYTGNDIELLGIKKGDSLSFVQQAIIGFLTSAMDGSGIIPIISQEDLCDVVSANLSNCGEISLNAVLIALSKTVCEIQSSLTNLTQTVENLDSSYSVECLSGVTEESTTHDVLQATITKICSLSELFSQLVESLPTEYVLQDNLNNSIANYLNSTGYKIYVRDRMVPYSAVEYYGPLNVFDGSGAGLDLTGSGGLDWSKVYLCNGNNNTPDKRGRVGVGCTNISGAVMDAAVLPGGNNPSYTLLAKAGANAITLTESQMPSHSHAASTEVALAPHEHLLYNNEVGQTGDPAITSGTYATRSGSLDGNTSYEIKGKSTVPTLGRSEQITVEVNSASTTLEASGGGNAHSNIQPVLACNYIIYLP